MIELIKLIILFFILVKVNKGYRISYSTSSDKFVIESGDEAVKSEEDDSASYLQQQPKHKEPGQQQQQQQQEEQQQHGEAGARKILKRSLYKKEISLDQNDPRCFERLKMLKRLPNQPIHLPLYLEEGETVTFKCHYCYNGTRQYASWFWSHIARDMKDGHYEITEVVPDMHDNEAENRVTIGEGHTLTIRNVRPDDYGTYFCRDLEKESKEATKWTSFQQHLMFLLFYPYKVFYQFDVILTKDMKPREISRDSKDKNLMPSPSQDMESENLHMYTSWEPWQPCSLCGKPGVRKRLGVCFIRMLNKTNPVLSRFRIALRDSIKGVPCRSTLFKTYPAIKTRTDEIEEETCNITCPLGMKLFKSSGSSMPVDELKMSVSFDQKKERKMKISAVTVSEGSAVNLTCPRTPIDNAVVWLNDTRTVEANVSNARVTLHATNELEIKPVEPWDNGTYRCVSHGKIRVRIHLSVIPKPVKDTAPWLYAYYTSLTYPVDFLIFLILMLIKHCHRRTGRHLTAAQLRDINSFSSRYSTSTTSGSSRSISSQPRSSAMLFSDTNSGSSLQSSDDTFSGDVISVQKDDFVEMGSDTESALDDVSYSTFTSTSSTSIRQNRNVQTVSSRKP